MTEETRDGRIRINSTDERILKAARDEISDGSLALGYVARLGAKKLLEDSDDGEVTF